MLNDKIIRYRKLNLGGNDITFRCGLLTKNVGFVYSQAAYCVLFFRRCPGINSFSTLLVNDGELGSLQFLFSGDIFLGYIELLVLHFNSLVCAIVCYGELDTACHHVAIRCCLFMKDISLSHNQIFDCVLLFTGYPGIHGFSRCLMSYGEFCSRQLLGTGYGLFTHKDLFIDQTDLVILCIVRHCKGDRHCKSISFRSFGFNQDIGLTY